MKFGLGQPVKRFEDLTLITGAGRYTDDIALPGMAFAYVLRSPVAHGNIRALDVTAARGMPGVLLVLTGEDVTAEGLGDVPCTAPLNNRDGTPRHDTPRPVLAVGKVRHVGQPVAFVVAETLNQAQDAGEAIVVDYDVLPAVTDARGRAENESQPESVQTTAGGRLFFALRRSATLTGTDPPIIGLRICQTSVSISAAAKSWLSASHASDAPCGRPGAATPDIFAAGPSPPS